MGSTAYGGARGGSLDVAPAPVTPVAAAPAPQAYAPSPASAQPAQPITYDTVPTGISGTASPAPVAASTSGATAAGGAYTVKKGDTLYSIAKTHYGSGKDVNKIVAANPGVSPNSLKVGQKIVLP